MPVASPPPPPRWSAPERRISLPAERPRDTLAARLTPADRAAGVADELMALAQRHGAVSDTRALSWTDEAHTPHALRLSADGGACTLTVRPDPGRAGALAAVAAEGAGLADLHRFLRHDIRVPVALAREALASHPAAADPDSLEATALDTLDRVAMQADRAGRAGAGAVAPGWLDLGLLADLALAQDAPRRRGRGLTVTRAVLPVVWGDPAAVLHAMHHALQDATPGVPPGGHLHLVVRDPASDALIEIRRVARP